MKIILVTPTRVALTTRMSNTDRHAELRNEIGDVTLAIKAFQIGCPWLAPSGYDEAPSLEWLKMQKNAIARQIGKLRAA